MHIYASYAVMNVTLNHGMHAISVCIITSMNNIITQEFPVWAGNIKYMLGLCNHCDH